MIGAGKWLRNGVQTCVFRNLRDNREPHIKLILCQCLIFAQQLQQPSEAVSADKWLDGKNGAAQRNQRTVSESFQIRNPPMQFGGKLANDRKVSILAVPAASEPRQAETRDGSDGSTNDGANCWTYIIHSQIVQFWFAC
jgi:hypothetical protein